MNTIKSKSMNKSKSESESLRTTSKLALNTLTSPTNSLTSKLTSTTTSTSSASSSELSSYIWISSISMRFLQFWTSLPMITPISRSMWFSCFRIWRILMCLRTMRRVMSRLGFWLMCWWRIMCSSSLFRISAVERFRSWWDGCGV